MCQHWISYNSDMDLFLLQIAIHQTCHGISVKFSLAVLIWRTSMPLLCRHSSIAFLLTSLWTMWSWSGSHHLLSSGISLSQTAVPYLNALLLHQSQWFEQPLTRIWPLKLSHKHWMFLGSFTSMMPVPPCKSFECYGAITETDCHAPPHPRHPI